MHWSLRHWIIVSFIGICGLGLGACPVIANYNPLSVPNNRVGVHILDPNELADAAKLINSSGGDWGYVTIPMRSNDRDKSKWQTFFTACRSLHVIPIIRLSTYPEGGQWVKPTVFDLVDFANFLNDFSWPTTNRYVILFNEPNHATEWGGEVSPLEYANLLLDAHDIFRTRSSDFFLLTAGLDMSAPSSPTSLDALEYYRQMTSYQPDWYAHIDGLSFHAYPNPGFTASVYSTTRYGPLSFQYELAYLSRLGLRDSKPLFITETGSLSPVDFYTPALTQVWTRTDIVAITPFLLFAGSPDFQGFSLLDPAHTPRPSYRSIFSLPKIHGSPLLANVTLAPPVSQKSSFSLPAFPATTLNTFYTRLVNFFFKRPVTTGRHVKVGETDIPVEIADTEKLRNQGLSDRLSLPSDQGMLFLFQNPSVQNFWMYHMHFALDFVWIRSGVVVGLASNIPPPSQTNNVPQTLSSPGPIDMVLELNAGFISTHSLKIGDRVSVLN